MRNKRAKKRKPAKKGKRGEGNIGLKSGETPNIPSISAKKRGRGGEERLTSEVKNRRKFRKGLKMGGRNGGEKKRSCGLLQKGEKTIGRKKSRTLMGRRGNLIKGQECWKTRTAEEEV